MFLGSHLDLALISVSPPGWTPGPRFFFTFLPRYPVSGSFLVLCTCTCTCPYTTRLSMQLRAASLHAIDLAGPHYQPGLISRPMSIPTQHGYFRSSTPWRKVFADISSPMALGPLIEPSLYTIFVIFRLRLPHTRHDHLLTLYTPTALVW